MGVEGIDGGGFGGEIVNWEKAVGEVAGESEQGGDEGGRLMGEAVVVLAPAGAGGKEVGGGVGGAPRDLLGLLEEFEMLEDLGSNDGKEGFVAGHGGGGAGDEVAGHAGEEGVLREELDDVAGAGFGEVEAGAGELPSAGGMVVEGVEFVAGGFVG